MKKRVVITGMGLICPLGSSIDEYLKNLSAGISGISRVDHLIDLNDCPSKLGGYVPDFDPLLFMSPKSARRMDRFSQMSVAASKLALTNSNIPSSEHSEMSVVLSSAVGGFPYGEEQHAKYIRKGLRSIDPLLSSRVFYGCGINQVCIELGIKGLAYSLTTGCAASLDAIGTAFELIKNNKTKAALCGGADSPFAPLTYKSFHLIGVTSTKLEKTPAPFDQTRDGIVLSEGAGVLILEDLEIALERGAKIYAEVSGFSSTHDAYHITQPAPDGLQIAKAINSALQEAELTPSQIDYILAHGSGTVISDKIESDAIKLVFGERAFKIPVTALESMIGHPLSAVGVLKTIAGVLAIQNSSVFPTINYGLKDPGCDLDYVGNEMRKVNIDNVMVNAFSFGGKNSILVIKKYK